MFHDTKTRSGVLGSLAMGLVFGAIGACSKAEPESPVSATQDEEPAAASAGASEGRVEPAEAPTFDELSVQFGGMWVWWQKTQLTIRGDGVVDFSMNKAPNDDARYTAQFRLSRKHLGQLAERLKETGWLTKPGANQRPGYTDATRIDMKLTRGGKAQVAWCHDRNLQPYLSLVNFLKRIRRQEYLLNRAVAAGKRERIDAFREIDGEIRSARGEPVATSACSTLDYNRFIPVSMDVILHPDEDHEETVVTALRVLAMLKTEKARQQITNLTTAKQTGRAHVSPEHRTGIIGEAAVEALTVLGGPQARQHVREMAEAHRSWERPVNDALVESLLTLDCDNCAELLKDMVSSTKEAAWGLVRLGSAGVPAILELLEERGRRERGRRSKGDNMDQVHLIRQYIDQVYLIRQYIDHWEELPNPIDGRVIEAVRKNLDFRLGYSSFWTKYHKELLQLASAPGLSVSCPREIAEAFLTAVKNNDETTMDGIVVPNEREFPEQVAELRGLLTRQRFAITEVYVDKGDNMALAMLASPDEEESSRVSILLNFNSGAVWRVGNIIIETGEQAYRTSKRILEAHPNAKTVPSKSADGPVPDTDAESRGEPTVQDKQAHAHTGNN